MRDILEDAEGAAERGDTGPGKANREQDKPVFPKRFYEKAEASQRGEAFVILLDGKTLKTPGKQDLSLPTDAAARLVATEWNALENEINPLLLPVTRLTNTALDGVAAEMQAVMEDIVRYAGSDLLCYRADSPEGLVATQKEKWDPVLDWVSEAHGANFEVTDGIMHVAQPRDVISAFGKALERWKDPFRLACIHSWTSLSGSAILALGLADGHLDIEACWDAAHVDEDWNISQWGEDYEAAERRKQRKSDFASAHNLFVALD